MQISFSFFTHVERSVSHIYNKQLNNLDRSVVTVKSQSSAYTCSCIDFAIARSIRQGLSLSFCCVFVNLEGFRGPATRKYQMKQLLTLLKQQRKESLKISGCNGSLCWSLCESHNDQLPCGLIISTGKALHRYCRGHGFESRLSLNFSGLTFVPAQVMSITAMIL